MSLPSDLSLGYVHLTVSDLNRSLAFYQNNLGLKIHRRENNTAYLGAGQADLLALTEKTDAGYYPNRPGLYHFAILVPSRRQLAYSLKHIAETKTPVQGFSDHLVSEAIYLSDPDGNGIELYRDRPRSDWRDEQGNFVMGTEQLDLDSLRAELEGQDPNWSSLHPDTVLGHMHLQVSSIPEAQKFYVNTLGFDLMASLGHALFVSAGGYHHHLGLNIWQSRNAPPPPPESIGLRYFTVQLPNSTEVNNVLDRVRAAEGAVEEHSLGPLVRDPSQNAFILMG